jgi:hypothetical protein
MKKNILFLLFLPLFQIIFAQNYSITGYVEDIKTGERIIGALVIDSLSNKSTTTNNYGFYSMKLRPGNIALYSSFVGIKNQSFNLKLTKDTFLVLKVNPVGELNEVVVSAKSLNQQVNAPLGMSIIPIKTITLTPALGEPDLLKSIQSQPGIKGGIEGSAGVYVRGGGGGENLFMLDDVPMYNVSHLYGFFSAFNTNAVKDVKILKGCFPARYGGRTSSVIDVSSIDGNTKTLSGVASIGLLSSRLTLEGPLGSKTTYMISGRRSYFDLFSPTLQNAGILDSNFPKYFFYDLNAKIAHTFNSRNRLYLSFYNGKDYIQNKTKTDEFYSPSHSYNESRQETAGWGNLIGSLRWNHNFKNGLFINTTLAYSNYNYFTENEFESREEQPLKDKITQKNYFSDYSSEIKDIIFKSDFNLPQSQNLIRFGFGDIYHTFSPGVTNYKINDDAANEKIDTSYNNSLLYSHEPYIYGEYELTSIKNLTINAGIRISGISSEKNISLNTEPRISASYALYPQLVIKTGYSRMVQYMHLLSSSGVNMPTDLWVPALKGLNPLKSDQINFGATYNYYDKALLTVEIYQKWMTNTTDLKNGASLLTDLSPWFNKTTQGNGTAKGLEISVQKPQGKITGNISYTLSAANRHYSDLNNGKVYPFKYDRLHDFSISMNFKMSEKLDISAIWIYGTGYPITLPIARYMPQLGLYNSTSEFGGELHYLPSRNNYRLPAYHRLDVGIHYKKTNHIGEHTISFDIFNAFNRQNPVFMYYTEGRLPSLKKAYLLPLIPSITYTLKFRWK